MRESVVRTSELPLELKDDPACSEPDPDPLNLSLPSMNAPNLAPSTPPAERVRAWAQSGRYRTGGFRQSKCRSGRSFLHSEVAARRTGDVHWNSCCDDF